MLKSLMIGLDGSDDNHPVLELGLRWATRFDALAVGLAVVDEPGILRSETLLYAGGHHWHATSPTLPLEERRAERILRDFARRCLVAGVTCRTLEDFGPPLVQILLEAQRFDLVLLGRRAHFDYGGQDDGDQTLAEVLRDCPRPVVAVPETLGGGESIVVAYDGSLRAARALYALEASGLGQGREVHVVSVAREHRDAARHADRAVEFLRLHGIEATPRPMDTGAPTAEVILSQAGALEAGLLVMGAYGQPALREFFLGSVTRSVLEQSPVPVFSYH